jgi:AcrR family transcriptional regulator
MPLPDTSLPLRPNLLAQVDLPPAPKQERSRKKRTALLEAALVLFAERGFEFTNIEDIAHKAEVAVGGFYQHFRTKHQVLLVLMDTLLAEIEEFDLTIQPHIDPRTQIEVLLTSGLQLDWRYRGAYRAWREVALRDPALYVQHQMIQQWTASRLLPLLNALTSFPGIRSNIDYDTLSMLLARLFWEILPYLEEDNRDETIRTLTDMMYHTLFHDKA